MLNQREHRLALLDDMSALFRDLHLTLTGLSDPVGTTDTQKKAIALVQKKLSAIENQDMEKLRKLMLG